MKKIVLIGLVLGAFALTSCKKEYKCDHNNGKSTTYSEKDYNQSQMNHEKSNCGNKGGKWNKR